MILAFFWALLAELSLAEPNTWVLWTDLDGADFFWTSSNCSTTVVPDSSIVDNTPAVAPSNGGISDMIFFPDTHEILWLEGGYLLRSWIDKTERRQLCQLPGDANASELENGNGTGAALGLHGEAGALAWTSKELTAVMFFASKMTKKLWVATLTSIPPRDASHVGTWIEVLGASVATSGASGAAKPVLMAREGTVYWTDGESGSFRSLDVPSALAGTATTATTLAQLGEGAWGEVTVAEATNDGRFLWIRQAAAETQLRLELILSLDALQEGPSSNYATGNVRTLYSFLDGDQPSALAVQPAPSPGLPYRGNITQLYQQVYWSVSGPDTQARIDHLDLDTGHVSTLTYALGLERRGAAPARPSALSVYPMPTVCVNVGCLYLRVWEECRICTVDQCDTCFLDTQDWVVKQWYASHGLFSNCLWLFPPKQGAWFVRNEVQQAKDEGLLPDDFVAQELPPDGATPVGEAVATVPPTRTATTATITSTVSSSSFTETSTTSTSLTLSSTNPCVAVEVLDQGVSDQSCSSMLDAWCQEVSVSRDNRSMLLAPQSLRRDCATHFWSFKELCAPSSAAPQSDSCGGDPRLWSVLFAAGLALMLAVLVPFCCYAMRRVQPSGRSGHRSHRSHRGTGTISGLRHAALEKDVGGPGPVEDSQSHWCCRHYWTRYLRRERSRKDPSENEASKVKLSEYDDGSSGERRKSWETLGLYDVDTVRSSQSEPSECKAPETNPSIGSPRGADESVCGGLQQIFKGTWQPGLGSSSAALAAGRLTNAMQKFMSSNTRQGDKWRLLHDVEDILRTLGSALPGNLRSTAWAWHARQSGRLHRSDALQAAEEEAKSIAEDFREDLSSRLQSGVRLLELAELEGAESLNETGPTRSTAASCLKASKIQISFDQLKTRIEELGQLGPSRKNLITAGHLLDGYESLLRLSEELHSAQEAGAEDSAEMDQLVKEMKQLQEALEEELKGSGLPSGAWQATFDRFTQRNKRQVEQSPRHWLKGLKEAAARAARFGHALKGSKGKGRLSEMEKTLMEELKSCEAAAKAGDSEEQSTSWKQLQKVWTQLQDQLDQVRKLQKLPGAGDGAEGGRLSSWAMSRSKLMHRSQTQPLQMKDLSPELSASAAELQVLQEEVEIFRQKMRGAATGEDGRGRTPLLMAGRQHLQQQEVEKLLRTAKAGASHSVALVDDDALAAGQEVSAQWQQLLSELEDFQADLAEPGPQRPGTSGRLSLGIGSRLSPKRGPKKASTSSSSKSSGSLPLDLLKASSAFLRHSEELARIRSQQSEDGSNPMLTLGQSIYTQQAGSTFAEHDPSWWQQLSEETGEDGIDPQSLQERLRRHHEILQQWRRDMDAEHAEQDLPMLAAKLAMHDRVLNEMLKNGALQGPIEAEDQELLRACKDAAQILSREILEASGSDATTAALLTSADGLGETCEPLDAALSRLGAWAFKRLEGVRQVAVRRGAADNALLTSLAAERADLLQWMEDHLDDSPALRPLRALLAEGSRELEMIAGAADVADPTDGDSLEKFGTKKKTFSDDDLLSELEEANRRLGRFDAELEKQRKALQRRRKKGLEAAVDPDVLASLVQERAALVDWAEDRLKTTEDPSLSAFRQHCRRAARGLEQLVMEGLSTDAATVDPTALLAEARRRLLMLEEEGNQRLRRRQRVLPGAAAGEGLGDQDPLGTFGTKKSRFDDHDWQSDLEEARRRLARFEQQLEEQRNGLQRRRKKGEDASVPEEILTSLVSERADLVEWAEDRLKTSADPSLSAFRQHCRAAARGLEQLVMEGLSTDAATEDPTALLAEARRRLILMEEEASKQRLKRRPRGAASKTGTTSRATASSRLKVVQDEDPQVLMADAARRLARLEAELESQRQGLCRRRLQPKTEAAEVQAAHALMHESAIEGLKDQRAKCRADCDRLLRAATADTTWVTWSPEQRAACNELQEKCAELEEEWKSCAETVELLKEEVAEAMPSRLTAMLHRNDSQAEASEALLEAMRRVASFDHELEQQRTLMRRRKAAQKDPGSTVGEDAMLMALLEEKRQAVAHCEEMAQEDEAWEDLHQLWQGVLTSSLLELATPQKTQVQRGTISAAEKNQALAEAQRRLDRLDEESERQRLGLKRRRKGAEEAGRGRRELEKLVETGTEFEHLATEHREGLNHQQNNIKEVMASDVEALEEIEHWRQMVGLEELQAAAGKMSEQLASIEGEEIEEIAVEREKRQKPQDVSAEERSAAKQQCQEMQLRLQEMRQDEEERQRLLMQRRQRKVKEPPEHAEKAARITEENSRDLLLKAHECITEGNPGDVQALRQQLQDLRADAFSESKEEPQGAAESDTQKPAEAAEAKAARPPPKEELEAALAASTERMDLVKSLGADLLSQLEVLFSSEDRGDLASAVMNVVERWRGQLPQSHEASVPSDMYMEHMGAACEDAVKAVTDESDVNARRVFMAAYRERMASVSQATQVQAEREEEAESPSKPTSTSPSRFSRKSALARQSTVAFTTEAEVQNLRKTGENFARSFFLQTEEEDEEQARRMIRRLESRSKSRSRPGTAAPSPETSPLRRGLTQSLSMTASSWAFSPSGHRSEGGTNLA